MEIYVAVIQNTEFEFENFRNKTKNKQKRSSTKQTKK